MIALVAGATRGAGRGIAQALGEIGATVYCTGRGTTYDRPETIEQTAQLVDRAGGTGIAVRLDHNDPEAVRRLASGLSRLDVLVNDIWGGEQLFEWSTPVWEHDLGNGLKLLHNAIDTHLITSHFLLPLIVESKGLLVEVTDGTAEYNATRYRENVFYDLAKTSVNRMAWGLAQELGPRGATAVSLTPGWLRSEMMLDHFQVSEANWRDATRISPHFCISESPRYAGRAVAALAADADRARFNGQSLSSGDLAELYGFTDLDGTRPHAWRYIVEHRDKGLPADDTGYR